MENSNSNKKETYMDEALSVLVKQPLPEGQNTVYLGKWLNDHDRVFKEGKFYNNGRVARYVVIFAGVGAGKTDFTTKLLPSYGKVYYNCSRTMIKNQQIKDVTESAYKHNVYIATSWDLINPETFEIAENSDYIVIDEAHHLVSDSFTDAPSYVYELIKNIRQNQTVIMMTACYDSFKEALDSKNSLGAYLKLPDYPVCILDLRECCHNLQPKTIQIVSPIYAEKILSKSDSNVKRIYFYSSARKAYRHACNLITQGKKAVAITSSQQHLHSIVNSIIRRTIKSQIKKIEGSSESMKTTPQSNISLDYSIFSKLLKLEELEESVEKDLLDGKFPADVDYILATSRLREGVNIKGTDNIEVFTDIINIVDLVQIVGRVRKYGVPFNIECLYIIARRQMSFDDFRYRESQQIEYDQNSIDNYNKFFSETIRGHMEYEYGSDYYNREVQPLDKQQFSSHRKRIKRLYNNINNITQYPGQLYLKPYRNNITPVIDSYSIEQNDLWFIDNRLKLKDFEWSNPDSVFDVDPLVRKLKSIFKNTEIKVIDKYRQKPQKKVLKPDGKTKEKARSIVLDYMNRDINRDDLSILETKLVDAHFMLADGYIGSAIKKIGLEGKWKTTKRQIYMITEVIKKQTEVDKKS